jgi:trans-aconitate methyltransferase
MTLSARQYSAFEEERTRLVRNLVSAIPNSERQVRFAFDLGCGLGNSTEVLAQHFAQAAVSGIDSSDDMIEAAKKRMPTVPFAVQGIATWHAAQPMDVILANASLQWLPDHATVYPHLASQPAPGGSLAIQDRPTVASRPTPATSKSRRTTRATLNARALSAVTVATMWAPRSVSAVEMKARVFVARRGPTPRTWLRCAAPCRAKRTWRTRSAGFRLAREKRKDPSRHATGVSFSYSVGAGRFDGRDSQGRLLTRDQHDFRDFRICCPAAWRRQVTRSDPRLGNWWETGSAACYALESEPTAPPRRGHPGPSA